VSTAGDIVSENGRIAGRKLIAVLYADMVGYSRLIGLDDVGTLRRLKSLRRKLIDPAIDEHGGRLVQTGGDSLLIVFDSIDGAVRCAMKVQREVPEHDRAPSPDRAMRFRIGINIGDAIEDGSDLHGDAVNVAARLQAECPPGAICISRAVRDHLHGKLNLALEALGPLELKNIAKPIEAYLANLNSTATRPRPVSKAPTKISVGDQPAIARRSGQAGAGMIGADFDGRPAIAVVPFTILGGNPNEAFIADGIADEVINELASWRIFPVIARSSSFAFRRQKIEASEIGAKLGARYVVDGSFAKIGQRIRISARLIDATDAVQLAAERHDRPIDELPELQDEIAAMIVGSLAPEVLRAERHRLSKKPPKNATSYEFFLRGLESHYRYTKADNAEAQTHFAKAIQIDPKNAQAHALLASAMIHGVQLGWREDEDHNYGVADQLASRAVTLDPRSPFAHFSLGSTSMFLGRVDQALAEMRSAIRINPSYAAAYVILAHLLCYVGRVDEALSAAKQAVRLSPYDPRLGLWLPAVSQANYFLRNYEEAASVGQQALSLIPENPLAQRFAAASLGQLGRGADAEPIVKALRRSRAPTIEAVRQSVAHLYRDETMVEHMLEGLRKAGFGPA